MAKVKAIISIENILRKTMTSRRKRKLLEKFAKGKFEQYVLDDWKIEFVNDTLFNSNAYCIVLYKTIYIEEKTIKAFKLETLYDLFLHELAHAIIGMPFKIKGFPQHGKHFKDVCKEIGCKGYRAMNNRYIFDMYGRFKVTEEEEYEAFKNSPDYKRIMKESKII